MRCKQNFTIVLFKRISMLIDGLEVYDKCMFYIVRKFLMMYKVKSGRI